MKRGSKRRLQRNLLIVAGIIGGIFLIGWSIAMLSPSFSPACTRMMCYPQPGSSGLSEVECNSCFSSNPVFITGIFNVYKTCSMKEIMVYQGQEFVETKYSDPSSCQHKFSFFGT